MIQRFNLLVSHVIPKVSEPGADFTLHSRAELVVKWPISGHCLARSGLHAPSAKTNEPRALALQSLILHVLGILFQQEEVGIEDSMLLGNKTSNHK